MRREQTIETERLILHASSWRDAHFLFSLIGNARVRHHLGGTVPIRRRLSVISSYLNIGPEELVWTVRLAASLARIGLMSVTKHKDGREFELSYQFLPTAWGRGYAFEASSEIMRFVSHERGLQRLIAETRVDNQPSCRLLQKLGMIEQKRLLRYGAEQVIYSADLSSHSVRYEPHP